MAESDNSVIEQIENFEIVRQHFGYWPNFHDAEIIKVTCEADPGYYASVTFVIAAFKTSNEIDEEGYYKQTKHCTIELQFIGIKNLEFDYFGHQNVILNLEFEALESSIRCTIQASVGLDAVIVAERVQVLKLTPTKQQKYLDRRTPD